jgi:CpeT protein
MRSVVPPIFLLTVVAALGGCAVSGRATASAPKAPAEADLARLTAWMAGSFSSHDQAAADPGSYRDASLHIAAIWPERTDGRWLYVEQSVAQARGTPYRQRVYRLHIVDDGPFQIDVFELPGDPLKVAGQWRGGEPLKYVSPASLKTQDGCELLLHAAGPDAFEGGTRGVGCPSSIQGAAYSTSEITVRINQIGMWDRGFAHDGTQVWGARNGPYIFKKVGGP